MTKISHFIHLLVAVAKHTYKNQIKQTSTLLANTNIWFRANVSYFLFHLK